MKKSLEKQNYWTKRYQEEQTGWDIGYASTPIIEYCNQLADKDISILIPGAGNAYEAAHLWKQGFQNIFVLDISEFPLKQFQKRNPDFPKDQLLLADFFEHKNQYDLILEQTFFCSFPPTDENRFAYTAHMAKLLKQNGKLVGVWFDTPLTGDMERRPFGGNKQLYLNYLEPLFVPKIFERCHNSIPARIGNELFGIFIKNKVLNL